MNPKLSLHYVLREAPQANHKTPIVLMLHGYGSHENDLFSLVDALPPNLHYVSLRAPKNLGMGGFAWYDLRFDGGGTKIASDVDGAKRALNSLRSFLRELRQAFSWNDNPLWLLGFSQGTILSYSYALNYPTEVQKVVALSGYLMKELVPEQYKMPDLQHLQFFVSHGSQDPVIPVEAARMSVSMLEKLKIAHQFREYPAPHGLSEQNLHDLKQWFYAQG